MRGAHEDIRTGGLKNRRLGEQEYRRTGHRRTGRHDDRTGGAIHWLTCLKSFFLANNLINY